MQSLQKRFRTKSSAVESSGKLNINPVCAIQCSDDSKIHSPIHTQ